MKFKTKKEQIREKLHELDKSIKWQNIKVHSAKKRYERKCNWVISFWITENTDTLNFYHEREKNIEDNLKEYSEKLHDELMSCKN